MATSQSGWLTNAKVLDVEDGEVLVERNVEMVDGVIRAISSTLPRAGPMSSTWRAGSCSRA